MDSETLYQALITALVILAVIAWAINSGFL